MKVQCKRVYEPAKGTDGFRVLIDRLWPRGLSKSAAKIDLWAKDVTPSTALRQWFHKDLEERFKEFSAKYQKELTSGAALKALRAELREHKKATLVTGVKDIPHSHIPTLLKALRK